MPGSIVQSVAIKSQGSQLQTPAWPRNFHGDSLRKHAYANILKISPPKTETFQIKNSDIFHTSAQNIDCGYSLEPPR